MVKLCMEGVKCVTHLLEASRSALPFPPSAWPLISLRFSVTSKLLVSTVYDEYTDELSESQAPTPKQATESVPFSLPRLSRSHLG